VIAHGKFSFYVCFNFSRPRPKYQNVQNRYATYLSPFVLTAHLLRLRRICGWSVLSLLLEANETRMSRLRNLDTEPPSSYCYEFRSDNRLESVANAHTAADLHVRPWFSNRADLESRGRRERCKRYIMPYFPQRK
jgi:hypothetical protein